MEKDFASGGRGAHLIVEVPADIAAGTKLMEEFLAEAKATRKQLKTGK